MRLIAKGDIIGAKQLGEASSEAKQLGEEFSNDCIDSDPVDCEGSHMSGLTGDYGSQDHFDHNKQQPYWDNFQFTEAMAVLNKFLKPKPTKCSKCKAKNPKISKPTFGWLHMVCGSWHHIDFL